MNVAHAPIQRPRDARLLIVDEYGTFQSVKRDGLMNQLRQDDLLVANDAATIPASLHGTHERSGAPVEVRLAGRRVLATDAVNEFTAVVFGAGDHRMRTEDRPAPPAIRAGDRLALGPLRATVFQQLGHPRLVVLYFPGTADEIWNGIASHGRPVQYAHIPEPLALWHVWTKVASRPVAFEPPSAGFVLDWRLLSEIRARGVRFATLTLAAGLSSTGDAALDARLPLEEAYEVPEATVRAVERSRARGGRVVALGTTVTRALEHAVQPDGRLLAGEGLATQRIGPQSVLRVTDAILSGVHEPGESHYELLSAFTDAHTLRQMSAALERGGFRTHEYGDSVLIVRGSGVALAHPA